MPRFVFVSGTDTGVGKTLVSTGLARALRARGFSVVAIKPIETGCGSTVDPGEDGARLALATGQPHPKAALLRLRPPVTPALAAERDGVAIDLRDLVRQICTAARDADVSIVEGAGGLLAPITWELDFAHLVRALDGESVVLVAANRLGVIHQVRAAAQCASDAKLALDAVVLSDGAHGPASEDASVADNLDIVSRYTAAFGARDRVFSLPPCANEDAAASRLEGLAAHVVASLRA